MNEEVLAHPGDTVQILEGDKTGEIGRIIAVYNNSASIELDKKEANGKPSKTVLAHKKYKVIT
jgi:ribosomal protein L24